MVSNFLFYLALPFISDISFRYLYFIFRCAKALGLAQVCNRSRWNRVSFVRSRFCKEVCLRYFEVELLSLKALLCGLDV